MGVPGRWSTTEVLEDVEPMTSDNIFWGAKGAELGSVHGKEKKRKKALTQNHRQHGNADRDQQVNNHLTTFLHKGGKVTFVKPDGSATRTSALVVVTVVGEAM